MHRVRIHNHRYLSGKYVPSNQGGSHIDIHPALLHRFLHWRKGSTHRHIQLFHSSFLYIPLCIYIQIDRVRGWCMYLRSSMVEMFRSSSGFYRIKVLPSSYRTDIAKVWCRFRGHIRDKGHICRTTHLASRNHICTR